MVKLIIGYPSRTSSIRIYGIIIGESAQKTQIIMTALNGNLVIFCADPATDEVFGGVTDRPVRIKRGEEGNEAGGNDRYLKKADL